MRVLGIETSCDETAVAIVEDGRKVLANLVFSQIFKHKDWGGVIPEFASRLHLETLNDLLAKLFEDSGLSMDDVDAIAITQGPGLVGSLMVGLNIAKTLAWIHQKPLIPVNHLHGHICANYLDSDLEPPFLCMLASGGHTQIIKVSSYTEMEILSETVDDAAGEAFDKVARLMGLPYPGGPHLDKLAQTAEEKNSLYILPIAMPKSMDFSFSGLKTAVLRLKEKIGDEVWQRDKALIAKSFQDAVAKTFYKKTLMASEATGITKIVLAGGVSANSAVRALFKQEFGKQPYDLVIPSLKFCTDNAAMIASAGFFNYQSTEIAENDYAMEVYSRV